MGHPKIITDHRIVRDQRVTLLELLDRLLDKGVVVKGELLLTVADIDLVYLNIGLLLSSVKTVKQAARNNSRGEAMWKSWQTSPYEELLDNPSCEVEGNDVALMPFPHEQSQDNSEHGETIVRNSTITVEEGLGHPFEPKANIDPRNVEKGLARLVLTLVELIRKLMEKQAVRRIDAGQLHAQEIDRVGDTFFLLDKKMEQLKQAFGLQDEDLNLDLGPLGDLL